MISKTKEGKSKKKIGIRYRNFGEAINLKLCRT